jgi:hypothetical protein
MSENRTQYPDWITCESEQVLHDDFRAFVWLVWRHLKLPHPTRRQLAIARYLQHGSRRRMIQAFRGVGKTWLTCAYALWRLYRDPQERVKIVSANEDKAVENAVFMRRLIDELEQLHFLKPSGSQRDSVLAFDVGPSDASVTPSVSCVGITGQLTGGRATILIADDIEVPKNSYTETMREKLAELVKEFDAMVVPEGFDIIYLGTPQTEQSIYNAVRTRGYECRIWPARYPSADQVAKYGSALAEDILADLAAGARVGASTDPQRFSDLDLAEREASYGRSGFTLQFMLDTSLSDAERYPLRASDLIVMDVPTEKAPVRVEYTSDPRNAIPDLANLGFAGDRYYRPLSISEDRTDWQGTILYVDPSGRGKDETAYAALRLCNGTIYLVGVGGYRDGYGDTTLRGLAMVAKRLGVHTILVEPNMGDGMFVNLLQPVVSAIHGNCRVEEADRAMGQKERRIIETLEPVLNQHRLVVDLGALKADLRDAESDPRYSLMYQLTHITKERGALRQDDRLDALAGGVAHFVDRMSVDASRALETHREALRDEEFRKFVEAAGVQGPTYEDRCSLGMR